VGVVVTQIAWDGSLRRRVLDTAGLPDAARWETLIGQILAAPPPYRAAPGRPVYVIHAGDRAIVAAEDKQLLEPWVAGQMDHVIAIRPQIITGIRLVGWCR
jgi:hypothetical protein